MSSKKCVLALLLLAAVVLMPLQTVAITYDISEKMASVVVDNEECNILSYYQKPIEMSSIWLRNLDPKIKAEQALIESHPIKPREFPNTIVINAGQTYVIQNTIQTYTDTGFVVYGNLTIVNSDITFDGFSGIIVKNGGALKVVSAKITYEQTLEYAIEAEANTRITISGGKITGSAPTFFCIGSNYSEIGIEAILTVGGSNFTGISLLVTHSLVSMYNVGMFESGLALYLDSIRNAVIRNCIFKYNSLAMKIANGYGFGGEILIEDCKFEGNGLSNILVFNSANIKIARCLFRETVWIPMQFEDALNLMLINNTMVGVSPVFVGDELKHFSTHTIRDNVVNGKSLLYMVNATNQIITGEYGAIILAGSKGITVRETELCDVTAAITVAFSDDVLITSPLIENVMFGILAWEAKVSIKNANIRYSRTAGVLAENSMIFINKTQLSQNFCGVTISGGELRVLNSVIYMNTPYGIALEEDISAAEVHYCSIYSNQLHGIYSAANVIINASYNWWGVNGAPPELKETGDPYDPEEVWGIFTDDTFTTPLPEPIWLPSDEGVVPEHPPPQVPPPIAINVPLFLSVILGVVIAIVVIILRKRVHKAGDVLGSLARSSASTL